MFSFSFSFSLFFSFTQGTWKKEDLTSCNSIPVSRSFTNAIAIIRLRVRFLASMTISEEVMIFFPRRGKRGVVESPASDFSRYSRRSFDHSRSIGGNPTGEKKSPVAPRAHARSRLLARAIRLIARIEWLLLRGGIGAAKEIRSIAA